MTRLRSLLAAATLSLFVAACGGDGPTDPMDNGGDGGDAGGGGDVRSVKANPSFSRDIFEIFGRKGCTASGCHGGGAGGLTLADAGGSHAALVNVASNGTGEILVIPNDAANSYLVKKLEGTAGAGSRMPVGGSPLDSIDMTNIKNWINQGAANN